jgi:hypothetical protein
MAKPAPSTTTNYEHSVQKGHPPSSCYDEISHLEASQIPEQFREILEHLFEISCRNTRFLEKILSGNFLSHLTWHNQNVYFNSYDKQFSKKVPILFIGVKEGG